MSSTSIEISTVEECRAGAEVITDERLWDCVDQQCRRIKVQCGGGKGVPANEGDIICE